MPRLRPATVLAVAICGLLATAQLALAAPARNQPAPVQPESACADVAFVGARGSGEAPGLGATVRDAADRYQNRVGVRATVETRPVEYPAVSILDADLAVYNGSVAQGASAIRAQASSLALRCPNTRYVLVGYSQGAHAITRFLETIDPNSQLDRALTERIIGIALFGSPVFAYDPPEQVNRSLWGPTPYSFLRQGVYLALNHAPLAERSVLSRQPWVAKSHSYCIERDVVCQASSPLYRLLNQLFGIEVPPSSIEPHSQYRDHYTEDAAGWLAGLTDQALRSGDPRVSPFVPWR